MQTVQLFSWFTKYFFPWWVSVFFFLLFAGGLVWLLCVERLESGDGWRVHGEGRSWRKFYWPKVFTIIQYQDNIIDVLKLFPKSSRRHRQNFRFLFPSINIEWLLNRKTQSSQEKKNQPYLFNQIVKKWYYLKLCQVKCDIIKNF